MKVTDVPVEILANIAASDMIAVNAH